MLLNAEWLLIRNMDDDDGMMGGVQSVFLKQVNFELGV